MNSHKYYIISANAAVMEEGVALISVNGFRERLTTKLCLLPHSCFGAILEKFSLASFPIDICDKQYYAITLRLFTPSEIVCPRFHGSLLEP